MTNWRRVCWWFLASLLLIAVLGILACSNDANRLSRPNIANPTLGFVEFQAKVASDLGGRDTIRVTVVEALDGRPVVVTQLQKCSSVKVDMLDVDIEEWSPKLDDSIKLAGFLLDPCDLIASELVVEH